ncbi:hypothetical protein [Cyclobacterium marinum]|uniref:Uncharacterized protein n=1 Tax=Cyclobacterium marinum (strain ATCC 25205 / DSM 745 / LMG 13164 / NCIMB 1802) TaxID=880070 RepID=G0IZ81_CYCMS|nr:hypothetical protein [Cyclobacterium marinum]AEL23860.1 hypothetical protein Cycma_0075 [Cyclobacterium marinum DSM 745]
MRGKNALYNDLFPSPLETTGKKSQRNTFIDERDEALSYRYYYHAHLCRLRYEECLQSLKLEFFLSHNVIIQRLNLKTDLIKLLVAENAQPADLRKKYNHYNWTVMNR